MCDNSCRNRCFHDNIYLDYQSSPLCRLLLCPYTEKVLRDVPGNPRLNLDLHEYAPLSPFVKALSRRLATKKSIAFQTHNHPSIFVNSMLIQLRILDLLTCAI